MAILIGGRGGGVTGSCPQTPEKSKFLRFFPIYELGPFREIVGQLRLVFLFLGYFTQGPGELGPGACELPPSLKGKSCCCLWQYCIIIIITRHLMSTARSEMLDLDTISANDASSRQPWQTTVMTDTGVGFGNF